MPDDLDAGEVEVAGDVITVVMGVHQVPNGTEPVDDLLPPLDCLDGALWGVDRKDSLGGYDEALVATLVIDFPISTLA